VGNELPTLPTSHNHWTSRGLPPLYVSYNLSVSQTAPLPYRCWTSPAWPCAGAAGGQGLSSTVPWGGSFYTAMLWW